MKTPIPLSSERTGFRRLAGLMGPRLVAPAPQPASGDNAQVGRVIAAARFRELEASYDPVTRLVQGVFGTSRRPTLTSALMGDLAALQDVVAVAHSAGDGGIRYMAWASKSAGSWNLGIDLDLVARLVRDGDRAGLQRYALSIVGVGHRNQTSLDLPLVTISLISGDALGAGFELALSSNVIIAERSARFGLPEILFNLFPGLGAYSYLARRIAPGLAERMLLSGRLYSAAELYDIGVIDMLCEDGGATEALYAYMGRNDQRQRVQRAIFQARRHINPLSKAELEGIAESWAETALGLSGQDLQLMKRMDAARDRRPA